MLEVLGYSDIDFRGDKEMESPHPSTCSSLVVVLSHEEVRNKVMLLDIHRKRNTLHVVQPPHILFRLKDF